MLYLLRFKGDNLFIQNNGVASAKQKEPQMETVTKTDKTVAIEILKQLGGNKFLVMTGAKNLTCDNNSMGFMLSSRITKNKSSFVKITLNVMDTYDIEFKSIRNFEVKEISKIEGVYNDQLVAIFEKETGLATSLGGR